VLAEKKITVVAGVAGVGKSMLVAGDRQPDNPRS